MPDASPNTLPTGYDLGGYTITRVIGTGGFGITYEAINPVTGRRRAIKEFYFRGYAHRDGTALRYSRQEDQALGAVLLEKFRATTTHLCALEHPNIVQVENYLETNGTGYMIMELLEGETFEDWLAGAPQRPDAQALRPVLDPILDALAYVHSRGLIHRDVAPDNIVITREGRPVLIDFGALSQDLSKATRLGTMGISKPNYTAPEQARRDARPDPHTDIYSVGALLYRAASGAPPEDGPHRTSEVGLGGTDPYAPLTGRSDLDPILSVTADACLALHKVARPMTIAAVRERLGWTAIAAERTEKPETVLEPEPDPVPDQIAETGLAVSTDEGTLAPLTDGATPTETVTSSGPPKVVPPAPPPADPAPEQGRRKGVRVRGILAGLAVLALAALAANYALLTNEENAARRAPPVAASIIRIQSVAVSPDGRMIASGATDNTVKLWSAASGELLRTYEGHTERISEVVFSPDGRRIGSSSYDDTVKIWLARSDNLVRTLAGHSDDVGTIAFSPDSRLIASGGDDNTIRLEEVESGRLLRTLQGHTDDVRSVVFSPDGRRIVSGSEDGTIRVWDADNGRSLRTIQTGVGWIFSVAMLADGRRIVSGNEDDTVRIWDAQTGATLKVFQGHTDNVLAVAASPDGTRIASAGIDKTVRIWDAQGGILRVLSGHTDTVWSVAFSPDGRTVVSSGDDGTIRIWDVETGNLIRRF